MNNSQSNNFSQIIRSWTNKKYDILIRNYKNKFYFQINITFGQNITKENCKVRWNSMAPSGCMNKAWISGCMNKAWIDK